MANPEHLKILHQGQSVWKQWRWQNREEIPDLSEGIFLEIDLSEFDLRNTNLARAKIFNAKLLGANLANADLKEASISECDFFGARLTNANLTQAKLTHVRLANADLQGAIFVKAWLCGVMLDEANLTAADFNSATMLRTSLTRTSLGRVSGLQTVEHWLPSSLGLDTFFASEGNIPENFLRGCGMPDIFLTFARSLVGQPFDYHSVFISYSHQDEQFAQRLYADLQAKGVRCWFAPEDMKIGDKFREVIDRSIHVHEKLLLVLSEHSVRSDWVEKEVETAMEKERKHKRTVLFPIRLDDAINDITVGWPADIRRARHICNFTDWKNHDAYQKAFERLLRDLKADAKPQK